MSTIRLAFAALDDRRVRDSVVFAGTRVPVRALFDALEGNHTLEDFLRDCPAVSRHQAMAALQLASDVLVAGVHGAEAADAAAGALRLPDVADPAHGDPAAPPFGSRARPDGTDPGPSAAQSR